MRICLPSFGPTAPDPSVRKWLRGRIDNAFGIAEKHLANREYVVGSQPTIAEQIWELKHSDDVMSELKRREDSFEAEMATGAVPDWAGQYYDGDGLGKNIFVRLSPQGGFIYTWSGCMGLYAGASATTCSPTRIVSRAADLSSCVKATIRRRCRGCRTSRRNTAACC